MSSTEIDEVNNWGAIKSLWLINGRKGHWVNVK